MSLWLECGDEGNEQLASLNGAIYYRGEISFLVSIPNCGILKRGMRIFLRVTAATIILVVLVLWIGTGAQLNWTQTSKEIKTPDEITGLERREWKRTFVPGLDLVAAAALTGIGLTGVSFLWRKKKVGNDT